MNNFVLITSVINTPNTPLSYSAVRSVFTRKERYEQTKKTIESIKKYIPNCKIMIIECTDFTKEESDYFNDQCDYVVNLWHRTDLHHKIFGLSKASGEGTMTIEALKFIIQNRLSFKHLFKICGRYWINKDFKYNIYDTDKFVFKKIDGNKDNIFTSFFKIPFNKINHLLEFLQNAENIGVLKRCIGYEVLFSFYVKNIHPNDLNLIDKIGYEGWVTVCGEKYIG